MNTEPRAAAATVVELHEYLEQLKAHALSLYGPEALAARGYITPSQELALRQLQLGYWKSRLALLEIVDEIRAATPRPELARPEQFLVALAAAAVLVDAARWMRRTFHKTAVLRRKLDEPDPVYGLPPRMYDNVQRSLVSTSTAWHLWQATRYYDRDRDRLAAEAAPYGGQELVQLIDKLRDQLRPSVWLYLRTRFRVRGRRTMRRLGRDVLGRAMYALQQLVSERVSEVFVSPGHRPGLPDDIREQVLSMLRPGDVLVVRKEYAATNYFLPGYWPHAALVLGAVDDLVRLGIADHEHVQPRLRVVETLSAHGAPPRQIVLEAMKDGVRVRSIDSPLSSDSIIVLRPQLEETHIATALSQGLMHEGKPYDFNFDFCYSHRMVCTEVVYRAYDGVGGVTFELQRHVGRYALAAGDLLRMGLAERHFQIVAAYSPAHALEVKTGGAAADLVRKVEGHAPGA
jgi:hypothetical protein